MANSKGHDPAGWKIMCGDPPLHQITVILTDLFFKVQSVSSARRSNHIQTSANDVWFQKYWSFMILQFTPPQN